MKSKAFRKSIASITATLLMISVFAFATPVQKAEAEADMWWIDDWMFRKKVVFSGFTQTAEFAAVRITMDFDEGKVQDCEKEIRVLNDSQMEEIPVNVTVLETSNGFCTEALLKFEIDATAGQDTTVFVYYGNPNAPQPDYYDVLWDNFNRPDQACVDLDPTNFLGCEIEGQLGNDWTVVAISGAASPRTFTIENQRLKFSGSDANPSGSFFPDSLFTVRSGIDFREFPSYRADVEVAYSGNFGEVIVGVFNFNAQTGGPGNFAGIHHLWGDTRAYSSWSHGAGGPSNEVRGVRVDLSGGQIVDPISASPNLDGVWETSIIRTNPTNIDYRSFRPSDNTLSQAVASFDPAPNPAIGYDIVLEHRPFHNVANRVMFVDNVCVTTEFHKCTVLDSEPDVFVFAEEIRHTKILSEVQNIEKKLDGAIESLITQIMSALTSIQNSIAQILDILQNVNIGATKSLSVDVPAGSTFVIGAPDSEFPSPDVEITNPFDPARDSNIKICVDATSLEGNDLNKVTLNLDVAGDGDFSIHDDVKGAGKGETLKDVKCFVVAARDFQLIIENNEITPEEVEVAIIWSTGKII